MKSRNTGRVSIELEDMPDSGKKWCRISLSYLPSFEHLFYEIQYIGHAERLKYPNGKGAQMVTEFLVDATRDYPRTDAERARMFDRLARKYKLPPYGPETEKVSTGTCRACKGTGAQERWDQIAHGPVTEACPECQGQGVLA